jgi:hypothetical protein
MEVARGKVCSIRRLFKKLPPWFLNSGLLWLYGVCYCHEEAVPFLPVFLDAFCELHPEASAELYKYDAEFTFSPHFRKWSNSTP